MKKRFFLPLLFAIVIVNKNYSQTFYQYNSKQINSKVFFGAGLTIRQNRGELKKRCCFGRRKWCIPQVAERQKANPDNAFIKSFPCFKSGDSIRILLNHTAGITESSGLPELNTNKTCIDIPKNIVPMPSREYYKLPKKNVNAEGMTIGIQINAGGSYTSGEDINKWMLKWSEALKGISIPR